ncbi:hypothetical protein [Thalassotalea aquiviva]|uniref:hypothetical protein n=1 Tax=Thalassotalea aquiviva TaxID=3242415 RepID=UPI00352BA0EA
MPKSKLQQQLDTHRQLIHSENLKVTSHVQREQGDWILNTLMIDKYSVPFKYKRKKLYRILTGQKVNLTYYPEVETIAGFQIEVMKVVRVKVA